MPLTAQTWPQFVHELSHAGLTPSQLLGIRAAFDRARQLFAGAERPDGKPFLDHLVGTASGTLLAGVGADAVAAALLHAAYDLGDFGGGRRGAHQRNRRDLRVAVGPAVEALVHRYHTLGWGPEVARRCRTEVALLAPLDRDVVVIRLANEIDDSLDGALQLSGKVHHSGHRPEVHDDLLALAEALATPAFLEVARVTLSPAQPTIPAVLVVGRGRSTVQLPASATWRFWPRAVRITRTTLGRVRPVYRRLTHTGPAGDHP